MVALERGGSVRNPDRRTGAGAEGAVVGGRGGVVGAGALGAIPVLAFPRRT